MSADPRPKPELQTRPKPELYYGEKHGPGPEPVEARNPSGTRGPETQVRVSLFCTLLVQKYKDFLPSQFLPFLHLKMTDFLQ